MSRFVTAADFGLLRRSLLSLIPLAAALRLLSVAVAVAAADPMATALLFLLVAALGAHEHSDAVMTSPLH